MLKLQYLCNIISIFLFGVKLFFKVVGFFFKYLNQTYKRFWILFKATDIQD